ncbi:hypothetical protein [Mesobacillus harenae]|uniref:hypothetical protein n=1 Tax=Mesobacillus harenae TaxID=2213203 RepID=UPI001580BD8B|nr:hypothetical protein [Mesobacillus harenae]
MKRLLLCIALLILVLANALTVDAKSHPIEMLNWEEVNDLVPRYSTFTVLDVESKRKFKVQRRAGSRHADVQPLTAKDTKIMKEIYNGKWSWKRRAIIVLANDRQVAASMHGMPHGAGALKNNFPGHFCIHFYGSTTHRTSNMDISHKLMILKAAGKLERYISKCDPYELVNAYIAGIKQHDQKIVSLISHQKMDWEKIFPQVENVTVSRMEILSLEDDEHPLQITVPIETEWYLKNHGRIKHQGAVHLVRFSPNGAWKIDSNQFLSENNLHTLEESSELKE